MSNIIFAKIPQCVLRIKITRQCCINMLGNMLSQWNITELRRVKETLYSDLHFKMSSVNVDTSPTPALSNSSVNESRCKLVESRLAVEINIVAFRIPFLTFRRQIFRCTFSQRFILAFNRDWSTKSWRVFNLRTVIGKRNSVGNDLCRK